MGGTEAARDAAVATLKAEIATLDAASSKAEALNAIVAKAEARTDFPEAPQQDAKRQRVEHPPPSGSPIGSSSTEGTSTAIVVWTPKGTMTETRIAQLLKASPKFDTVVWSANSETYHAHDVFDLLARAPETEVDLLLVQLEYLPPKAHKKMFKDIWNDTVGTSRKMVSGCTKRIVEIWNNNKAKAITDKQEVLRVINDARASATNSSELRVALDIIKHKATKHALPQWEIARNELLLQGLNSEAQQLKTTVDEFEDHYIKTGSAEDAASEDAADRKKARPFYNLLLQPNVPWDATFLHQVAYVHADGIRAIAEAEGVPFQSLLPTLEKLIVRHMHPHYEQLLSSNKPEDRKLACFGGDAQLRLPDRETMVLTISWESIFFTYRELLSSIDSVPIKTPRQYEKLQEMPFLHALLPQLPVIPEGDTSTFAAFMLACQATETAMRQRVDTDDASKRAFNEAASASRQLMTADHVIPFSTLRTRFNNFCDDNDFYTNGLLGNNILRPFLIDKFVRTGGAGGHAGQICVRGFRCVDLVSVAPCE
mmetsp:Transcript_24575/g.62700  ORF Transcript_24575/g.62700 Transcript_24575/m.62700 type:complete len:540 (+) Transcript_24575:573-2192(+)